MPSIYKILKNCKNIKKFLPNISPQIYSLSAYSSNAGVYTIITIYGVNFSIFGPTGYSLVNFGSYLNINIIFLGSNSISFEVPINALPGTYNLYVTNNIYPTSLNSNSISYNVIA